jgi:hypothetical protein
MLGQMLEAIARIMDPLPPLRERKRPGLALILGFLFSGIGLWAYFRFRSLVDLIVPTAIWAIGIGLDNALPSVFGDTLFWGGAVIGGLWGFLRAINSNERLSRQRSN